MSFKDLKIKLEKGKGLAFVERKPCFTSACDAKYSQCSIYAKMAMSIKGFDKPYQLQKLITPEKFKYNKETQITKYPRVMTNCYKGLSLPNPGSIKKMNAHFPELEGWLYMPIWKILQRKYSSDVEFEDLLKQIKNKKIYSRILENNDSYCLKIKTKNLTKVIDTLLSESSIDSLSALTLLLAKAESIKKTKYKPQLFDAIYQVLVNLSVFYCLREEFSELFRNYRERFHYAWIKWNFYDHIYEPEGYWGDYLGLWYQCHIKFYFEWGCFYRLNYLAYQLEITNTLKKACGLLNSYGKKEKLRQIHLSLDLDRNHKKLKIELSKFIFEHFNITDQQLKTYHDKLRHIYF